MIYKHKKGGNPPEFVPTATTEQIRWYMCTLFLNLVLLLLYNLFRDQVINSGLFAISVQAAITFCITDWRHSPPDIPDNNFHIYGGKRRRKKKTRKRKVKCGSITVKLKYKNRN